MGTYERIETILVHHLFVPLERVMPSATFLTLRLDSLDQVEFAVEVEREFAVDLDHSIFATVSTVGELVFAIEKYQALVAHARAA